MKFEKDWLSYRVNGCRISRSALAAIGEEIFVPETWQGILAELKDTGKAERIIVPEYTARNLVQENAELKAILKGELEQTG